MIFEKDTTKSIYTEERGQRMEIRLMKKKVKNNEQKLVQRTFKIKSDHVYVYNVCNIKE